MSIEQYNALNTFRTNFTRMQSTVLENEFCTAPPGIHDLFDQFLACNPEKEDIKNLLVLLSNTDKREWDQIAHEFL